MKRIELINKYFEFFKSKDHKIIPNASLIPENDPTILFTTAGMHPLVPFLLGQKHPQGKRLVNVQRCIRTGDIEEVGDETHHTFFEMLGNWSLGDYLKKDSINYSFDFLTKILKIPKERLSVTVFKGDKDAPKDIESEKYWKELGINKINLLEKKDNWWGPVGKTGPCGPDTEIFLDGIEIWNNVIMEYYKDKNENYKEAKQKNIDTGMGVERTITLLSGLKDNYKSEIWDPLIKKVENLSNKKYEKHKKEMRIIVDHLKAAAFIINDGVIPSNNEQGYVLRRLIRRAVRFGKKLEIKNFTDKIVEPLFNIYPEYNLNKKLILEILQKEEEKFNKTLEKGLLLFHKITEDKKELNGKNTFLLFQSYGFPIEITKELAKEKKIKVNEKDFNKELSKHQELSRTATQGKFKSGLADNTEKTTKLHTAAHLLLESLKIILKDKKIAQKGSNINSERLRLDFNFPRKLTEKELNEIEKLVNEKIDQEIEIIREEMTLEKAKEREACGSFENKYGNRVSVYTIGKFSKEICTGPHVKNTKELGKFKIIKEESSSSGIRRIKAILE